MANVLITGGSRGIGAACVRRFAKAGHRVWFLYEKEHEAARAVAAETGAEPICADVSDGEAVRAAFRRCPDVDILVCNAGIAIPGLLSMLPGRSGERRSPEWTKKRSPAPTDTGSRPPRSRPPGRAPPELPW